LLTHWITKHIQGVGYMLTGDGQIALLLYFVLILPGVLLHEISHAVVAWVLRVRVRHLSIGIRRKKAGNKVALGSVDIARTDPIRGSLIGLAPLIAGCAAILLISNWGLRMDGFELEGQAFWKELRRVYQVPDFWLWVYLVLAIGNAMLPSAADRQSWGVALLFAAFAGIVLYFTGLLDTLSQPIARWARSTASQLTYAFGITIAVDLAFGVLLFTVEQGLTLLGFGRVQYQ
jgi:hypothetical protein